MLNLRSHLAALTLIANFVVVAVSQDAPPNYQHLKPIESMVGVWKARFDPPGNVPEGDLEVQFQWMGNKSYLQSVVYFKPDGVPDDRRMSPEFTIIGFDAQKGTTRAWHFKYSTQGQTTANITANRLIIHQQEGKPGDPGYRQQTKSYELEDSTTLVITDKAESADAATTNQPPLRLKKSVN